MLSALSIGIIVLLKYALPFAIIFSPFAAGWANFVLDTIDGDLLIPLGLSDPTYQLIDKLADWATYAGMVAAAWRFRWQIRSWICTLFVLRSVGQVSFFIFMDERIFFFFPNFLEPLFLVYATIIFFKKDGAHKFYLKHKALVWIGVILYKLQDEWITHIANIDRSDTIKSIIRKLLE